MSLRDLLAGPSATDPDRQLAHLGLQLRILLPGHRWQPGPGRYAAVATELAQHGATATFTRPRTGPATTGRAIGGALLGQALTGSGGGAIAGAYIGARARPTVPATITIATPAGAVCTTRVKPGREVDAHTFTRLFNDRRRPR